MYLSKVVVLFVVLFSCCFCSNVKAQRVSDKKSITKTFIINDTIPMTLKNKFSDSLTQKLIKLNSEKYIVVNKKNHLKNISRAVKDSLNEIQVRENITAQDSIKNDSILIDHIVQDSIVQDSVVQDSVVQDSLVSEAVDDFDMLDNEEDFVDDDVVNDSDSTYNTDADDTEEEFIDDSVDDDNSEEEYDTEEDYDTEEEFYEEEDITEGEEEGEELIDMEILDINQDSVLTDTTLSLSKIEYKWEVTQKGDTSSYWLYNTRIDSTKIWFVTTYVDSALVAIDKTNIDSSTVVLTKRNKVNSSVWADDKIVSAQRSRNKVINVVTLQQIKNEFKRIQEREYEFGIWRYAALANVHFSQGYVGYWSKAAESSLSNLTTISGNADYTRKGLKFSNAAEYKYGFLKPDEKATRKTNDIFQISSSAGLRASKSWYYQFLAGLQTPFFEGYKYDNEDNRTLISNFLSPGYLTLSLGMNYNKTKKFSFLCSPLTSKLTFVVDSTTTIKTKYGVEEGDYLKKEYGAYIKITSEFSPIKDVIWVNKLDLFSNYIENAKNIDIDWQSKFSFKVNQYIGASISTHLIYDDDVKIPIYKEDDEGKLIIERYSKKIQFMEIFTIGFTYKFNY